MQNKSSFIRSSLWLVAGILFITALGSNRLVASKSSSKSAGLVDVNSADVKTLQTLPGITHTLATRIAQGRPYKNLTDLKKVHGMTSAKLDAIKGDITFGTGATAHKAKSTKNATGSTGSEVATSKPKSSHAKQESTTAEQNTYGQSAQKPYGQPAQAPSTQTTPTTHTQNKELAPTGASSGRLPSGQAVNINTASLEELDALPGIGPTKAQAIIDYRNEHGPFNSIEDIQKVKGIKAGEFSKIKDSIRVE